MLIIELLRALARGDDSAQRVASSLVELFKHLSKTSTPLNILVGAVIADLHRRVVPSPNDPDVNAIVISSLRVAAAAMTLRLVDDGVDVRPIACGYWTGSR
jgi:hypothetical protein